MINYIKLILTAVFLITFHSTIQAATIITAPIDSRPISIEYMENLTNLGGDTFLTTDKKFLDYFSDGGAKDHFADSKAVREEIRKMVEENADDTTTVIINTTTYMTGGLVGSRCANCYEDYESALKEFRALITKYQQPYYYVNLAMPRNLPETRGNTIWPENEKVRGLGYYYLKFHKDSALKDYISKKFFRVTPTQMFMEWSYVENKKMELGSQSLTEWEKEYLEYIESNYKKNEKYQNYFIQYQKPFELTAQLFESVLRWQKEGLLDEIIIGNDDFQLPESISYLYKNAENDWIPLENGTPIKFSFSRTYMTTGKNSIYQRICNTYGQETASLAQKGSGEKINFIFGMDEIPQLIYARDCSRRNELTTNFTVTGMNNKEIVADYDVLSASKLVNNAFNFVQRADKKTEKQSHLFVIDYNNKEREASGQTINTMNKFFKQGDMIGLIELYNNDVLNSGANDVFQLLVENSKKPYEISIGQLAFYSAWNTNANAIGLGVAHGQVYGIAQQQQQETKPFLEAQLQILGQHALEDGIYTVKTKRQMSRDGFQPENKDKLISTSLYDLIQPQIIENAVQSAVFSMNNKKYKAEKFELIDYNFPWKRAFDCYLKFKVTVKEYQN